MNDDDAIWWTEIELIENIASTGRLLLENNDAIVTKRHVAFVPLLVTRSNNNNLQLVS